MMLPGFGIVSEVVAVMSRKPIFGYRLMALSLLGILILGFSVWAHHMFVAGMAPWLRVPMMVSTLLISIPTGIKIFSWLATLWGGKLHLTTPMLWAVGAIAMFTIGGLSGVYLGSVPIDIMANQTYFIVAHIHYVLFGGSIFTVFAGAYYWYPKMTGRMYDERLGKLHFWLTWSHGYLTFFPMHYLGLQGMPRRVAGKLRPPVRRFQHIHQHRQLRPRRLHDDLRLQHGLELETRQTSRRQPLARPHPRMAGQQPTPNLQLRRNPPNSRRPLRIRHPRRPPRHPPRTHARSRPGRRIVAWPTCL